MIMRKEHLQQYVQQNSNLVSMKSVGNDMYILKYKKKVFYDSLWNSYLEECRGSIVDSDFNLISYPFTKIYNYGIEKNAPVLSLDRKVTAFRKINGFMVAISYHKDDILISTTGSIDSDFVKMAKELIDHDRYHAVLKNCSKWTFMFECVHPNDPHIIPEKTGMYLLGYRLKHWNSLIEFQNVEELAKDLGCFYSESKQTTLGNLLEEVKTVRHEGFVFYTDDSQAAKIKSPYYLTSKFVARNPRTDKLMRPDIKNSIDEEYYGLIDAIRLNIEAYTSMNEQERLSWIRNFFNKV